MMGELERENGTSVIYITSTIGWVQCAIVVSLL